MKKLLSIAVASVAVAALADPFSPAIGVTQITTSLKNTVIPVQFSSLTNGNVTADSLVCTNGLPNGTCLYIFDGTSQSYSAWVLGNTGWVGAKRAGVDGIDAAAAAEGQVLAAGSALWISLPEAEETTFSLYGKVASVTNTTIVGGTKAEPKYNLVCNPTGAQMEYSTLIDKLSALNPVKGDTASPLIGECKGNFVYDGTAWKFITNNEGSVVVLTMAEFYGLFGEDEKFPARGAFWYVSKGGAGTISW